MVKKTYIIPAIFAVELNIKRNLMLSASDGTISDGGEGDGSDIGTKEITNKSIWDEEW